MCDCPSVGYAISYSSTYTLTALMALLISAIGVGVLPYFKFIFSRRLMIPLQMQPAIRVLLFDMPVLYIPPRTVFFFLANKTSHLFWITNQCPIDELSSTLPCALVLFSAMHSFHECMFLFYCIVKTFTSFVLITFLCPV